MVSEIISIASGEIVCQLDRRVLVVTFNRPHMINAFKVSMIHEFIQILRDANDDPDVGAVVVTGAGHGFSSGTDLSDGDGSFTNDCTASPASEEPPPDIGGLVSLQMLRMNKPVVGAINGAAIGFGATMLLPMDFRFSSADAFFEFVFARRGLMPEACSTWFLPKVVGIYRALDWVMTGRRVGAVEAKEAGFVHEVIDGGDLLTYATSFARNLLETKSPNSLMACRRALWSLLGQPSPEMSHDLESFGMDGLRSMSDFKEAVVAFRQKRPSKFSQTVDSKFALAFEQKISVLGGRKSVL